MILWGSNSIIKSNRTLKDELKRLNAFMLMQVPEIHLRQILSLGVQVKFNVVMRVM